MSRARWAALAAVSAFVVVYAAAAGFLWEASIGWDVAFLVLVPIPATFLVIWLALPFARGPGSRLLIAGIGFALLALVFRVAELDALFNMAKLAALTALGFCFLTYFETVSWTVLIAALIPWVDIWSVFFGPTGKITEDHFSVFEEVSIAFRVPGQDGYANLGPPDILFFALFLAAAARFGLRIGWTWLAMTALLGVTLVLTATTDVGGLPALPAICLGYLAANADLFWRALRPRRELRSD
ncbi:MAG: hypothetical protein H0T13_08850 [Actinobacteria bacterium]|nr:hypothetical protein [Actinomycetota bacterium]